MMTEELETQLEEIVKQLDGVVEYLYCSDLKTTRQKIVIEYNVKQK
jgi:hypothetical protein